MGGVIKIAIERPVAVLALIMLTVLFGVVALRNIPIQMSPDIEKPILEVRVTWPGASPEDVDREIVGRLESELAGIDILDFDTGDGVAAVRFHFDDHRRNAHGISCGNKQE